MFFSFQGKFWSTMGFVKDGRKCLNLEEALFLLDEVK